MRNYNNEIDEYGDVYTLSDFIDCVNDGYIGNYDGSGYWCKDGLYSHDDEVFSSEPEDATHVVWFNK